MKRFSRCLAVLALSIATAALIAAPAAAKSAPVTKMKFKLDTHNVQAGDTLTGSVHVWTHENHAWAPLAGTSLSLRVDGAEVGTLVTDDQGVANIAWTATEGSHVMRVVFAGDDAHKRAQRAQGFQVAAAAPAA